ncbi:MAG: DUF1365 domain-containing protein [Candidatus Dormibacteraeota bacterium]|nr:DUF1365 domain-containing protein [Candidatus Dormibacteraeota bacterium]
MTASCLYEGTVVHARFEPVVHRLRYGVTMMSLDLEELPALPFGGRLWSSSRPAVLRFRREDHLGDPDVPLLRAVRDLVDAEIGHRPTGPVRVLTQPRLLGAGFNPISIYYCYDDPEALPVSVVFEVSNTPWGEMHAYAVDLRTSPAGARRARGCFAKQMHVSPLLGMDIEYRWTLTAPADTLCVAIECWNARGRVMTAGIRLRRVELCQASLRRFALRVPPMFVVTLGGIYWNALRLRLRGAPYHPHPAPTVARAR